LNALCCCTVLDMAFMAIQSSAFGRLSKRVECFLFELGKWVFWIRKCCHQEAGHISDSHLLMR